MAEGFDDDGEDGAGDKLLTVLQKMDIGNIMVVVCIWNNGVTIGDNRLRGGEFFRLITDRARELLTSIKEGVQQTEVDDQVNKKTLQETSPKRGAAASINYDILNAQRSGATQTMTAKAVQGSGPQVQSEDKIDE